MSYYECKKCKYHTKLKSDMKRHLNKVIKCYNEDELNIISLNLINDNKKMNKNLICNLCSKSFSRIDSLNRHKKSYCKNIHNKNIISDDNLNNINIQNNIDKQININIEKQVNNFFILDKKELNIRSFDDSWNLEHFDNYMKLFILISKTKFTDFLSEVLKNKENLNVIVEKNSESGLVYKNDSNMYVKLNTDEILNQSMHKIYEHLQKIYDEYLNNELKPSNNIDKHFLESIKNAEKTINIKYNDYVKNNEIKKQVDNCLLNIYSEKKEDALEIAHNIKKLGY